MGYPKPTFIRQEIWHHMTPGEQEAVAVVMSDRAKAELVHRLDAALLEQGQMRLQIQALTEYVQALTVRAEAAERFARAKHAGQPAPPVRQQAPRTAAPNPPKPAPKPKAYVQDFSDVLADLAPVDSADEPSVEEAIESGRMDARGGLVIGVHMRWGIHSVVAISENISRSGMRLMLQTTPPEGHGVALELTLPKMPQISCRGRVRWTRPGMDGGLTGCGIEFVDLDPATANVIGRYAEAIVSEGRTAHFEPS